MRLDLLQTTVKQQRELGLRFRIRPISKSRFLYVDDWGPAWERAAALRRAGQPVGTQKPRRFSSEVFAASDEFGRVTAEIEAGIRELDRICRESSLAGEWLSDQVEAMRPKRAAGAWPEFAEAVWQSIQEKSGTTKPGSLKDYRGFLFNHVARFRGPILASTLEDWAKQSSPTQRRAWEKRIDFMSHVSRSGQLDMSELVAWMKAQLPKESRKQQGNRMMPRAIATHDELRAWLDSLGTTPRQGLLALIATYGLRPHEVWHVDAILPEGVGHLSHGKTGSRDLVPCPHEFVTHFQLRERLDGIQAWMRANSRRFMKPYPRDAAEPWFTPGQRLRPVFDHGRDECLVDDELGAEVRKWMSQVDPCHGKAAIGGGRDTLLPYDLRHCYAINLMFCDEVEGVPVSDFAAWMGHDLETHEKIYRRWAPAERITAKLAQQHLQRVNRQQKSAPVEAPAVDPNVLQAAIQAALLAQQQQSA